MPFGHQVPEYWAGEAPFDISDFRAINLKDSAIKK